MAEAKTKTIYEIISTIGKEAGGLAKASTGGVPFAFRGIDAVVNHLADKLDDAGVFFTAEVLDKVTTARDLPNNKALTQTDITVRYTFYAPDGSSITTEAAGLAQDHADRSAAQAQSVALRVALLQLFHLPTTDKSDERQYDEPEVMGEKVQRQIDSDTAAAKSAAAGPKETVETVRAEMGKLLEENATLVDGSVANAIMDEIAPGKTAADWTVTQLKKGRDKLRAEIETRKKNGAA